MLCCAFKKVHSQVHVCFPRVHSESHTGSEPGLDTVYVKHKSCNFLMRTKIYRAPPPYGGHVTMAQYKFHSPTRRRTLLPPIHSSQFLNEQVITLMFSPVALVKKHQLLYPVRRCVGPEIDSSEHAYPLPFMPRL